MPSSSKPLFLLGAGFNADAKAEVGPVYGKSMHSGGYEIYCSYPLVGDLAHRCFGLAAPPGDKSIEELFQEAWKASNFEPIQRLVNILMEADHYLSERLIPAFGATPNCYSTFFERFSGSNFLTFNYDSLPELLLLRQQHWYPHDGYGVPVEAAVVLGQEHLRKRSSTSLVLHLHGSLCLYTSAFTFVRAAGEPIASYMQREQPKYLFDPNSIGGLFCPFEGAPMDSGYEPLERRIIAPVPDKAEGLRKEFVAAIYSRAAELVAASNSTLVIIGYSFNKNDRSSYYPILSAVIKKSSSRILLVLPEATALKQRMESEHPRISWNSAPYTFAQWVQGGFIGLA